MVKPRYAGDPFIYSARLKESLVQPVGVEARLCRADDVEDAERRETLADIANLSAVVADLVGRKLTEVLNSGPRKWINGLDHV